MTFSLTENRFYGKTNFCTIASSLYNNLSFVNLSYFDPTTYFMFMQIRLLMTGIMYQVSRYRVMLYSRDLLSL